MWSEHCSSFHRSKKIKVGLLGSFACSGGATSTDRPNTRGCIVECFMPSWIEPRSAVCSCDLRSKEHSQNQKQHNNNPSLNNNTTNQRQATMKFSSILSFFIFSSSMIASMITAETPMEGANRSALRGTIVVAVPPQQQQRLPTTRNNRSK